MKKLSLLLIGTLTISSIYSQIYVGKNCEISFYSHSPIEDIKAVNKVTKPMLNASTGDVQMKIDVKEFIFPKQLMQEHFNED